nr:hypothetical protein [Tanacetum cinerariifolium]
MQEFWATVCTHQHSLRFKLNGRSHTLNVENFRDMLHIFPRLPGQRFKDPPLKEEIISFIRDLGHIGEIKVLTDVNVNYMHQPWRSFAAIINRCLSGKTTNLDSLQLSCDQSISRRNKMFWHNTRDDTMFNIIRDISRHYDTHVYDAILPVELTNQEMLDSKAYKEYYTIASGAKPPKSKTKYQIKSKAKVTKPDMKKQPAKKTKAKGLAVLSEVTLSEAKKIKLSKKDFHISHVSGSGDGVDTQSKVPDEKIQKTSDSEDKDDNDDDGDDDNDDGDNDDDDENDDHDDDSDDERAKPDSEEIPDPNLTNLDDEETMDDEVFKELYEDVNVNLEKGDAKMTDANQGGSGPHYADEPVQSSSVSFDFTSKFLNLENPSLAENEIASLMETSAPHTTAIPELTSGFNITTPPLPPFFNPLLQQQTPTIPTPTYVNPIVTLLKIPNFSSVFKFDQRVSALETWMSELKQTNQFTEVVLSIPAIVDQYLASKMKEAVNVDSTMKKIIKNQVKEQGSKIMPNIEKYVTESLGAKVLVRSSNQPQTAYAVAASLSEFELKKILIHKMKANKSIDRSDNQKNLYNALVGSYNSNKDILTLYSDVVLLKRGRDDQYKDEDPSARSDRWTKRRKYCKDAESSKDSRSKEKNSSSTSKEASQSQHNTFGKPLHVKDPSHTVEESCMQQDQKFITGDNNEQPVDKEVTKADWFKKPKRPTTPDPDWSKRSQIEFRPPQTWIMIVLHKP